LKQNKKVRFDLPESESFTTEPTEHDMSSSVLVDPNVFKFLLLSLVDFDTKVAKERALNEQERMVDLKNELMTEIYNLKQKFRTPWRHPKKMTAMFNAYMGDMLLVQSREMLSQMDLKTTTLTDQITKLMTTLQVSPPDRKDTTSPHQQRLREDGTAMDGVMQSSSPPS
jgi:hypothetical protein